jgi:hypothetical protein
MNEQELERRRPVVGASEVGLLFGLPAFGGRTASDLWYEKKFGTIRGGTGNASTNLGTKLEPVVLMRVYGGYAFPAYWKHYAKLNSEGQKQINQALRKPE